MRCLIVLIVSLMVVLSHQADPENIYGFNVKDIDGNDVSLEKYKGKVLLVVNVASTCGLTEVNYKQMNELYEKYHSKGLEIAAFPSNSFQQEEGSDEDIKKFAKAHKAKYDLYSKVDVNGDSTAPVYQWLKNKKPGILGSTSIKWNFTKFLVNRKGEPVERYSPTTSPTSIEDDIKKREICLSYFPVNYKYTDRQRRLKEDYGFVCDCDRCKVEANWSDNEEEGEGDMDHDDDDMDEDDGDGDEVADLETTDCGMDKENDDFPHAYFFVRYMCSRDNCGGTLAPLPPVDARPSTVMECNVCGSLTKCED